MENKRSSLTITLLFWFIKGGLTQVIYFGTCPVPTPTYTDARAATPVSNTFNPFRFANTFGPDEIFFNTDDTAGKTWFIAERYPYTVELGYKCPTVRFRSTVLPDAKTFPELGDVFPTPLEYYGLSILKATSHELYENGILTPVLASSGLYDLRVDGRSNQDPYQIIATDYDKWAVAFSCTNYFGFFHTRLVWIMTLERHPKPETMQLAYNFLNDIGFGRAFLFRVKHTDCQDYAAETQQS